MLDPIKPLVGIGVLIFKDGKVLMGQRKGSHGAGEFAFPGGGLEHGESFEDCARRETLEECGIEIENVRFQLVSNVLLYLPKHWVLIGIVADWKSGEPTVLEPTKCESWNWYDPSDLPTPMFAMSRLMLQSYQNGVTYISEA